MSDHGTRARYVDDECRCADCTRANRDYNNHRNRLKVYGRPTTDLIDAEPVRTHVRALLAAGMGTRAIAAAANLDRKRVTQLLNGRPDRGTPPTRRMKPEHAAALIAVTPAPADHALVRADGTHRRLQGLVVIGWSLTKIAAHLDMSVTNLVPVLKQDQVTAKFARRVAGLYRRLENTPPPETTRAERQSASRARNHAAARGWLPPAAWDEDLIDLPAPELAAEIDRQVNAMDDDELRRANNARKRGERSPVLVAAAKAWRTRAESAA